MSNPTQHTDSLDQYRDLLRNHGDTVGVNTAPVIAAKRLEAESVLLSDSGLSLPQKGSEGYEITDVNELLAPDLGVNILRLPVNSDVEEVLKCGLPTVSSLMGITINDSYRPTDRMLRLLPDGVSVVPFSKATGRAAEIIQKYYGKIAGDYGKNASLLLNTALAQDGLLIHVEAGIRLEKSIQLVNILQEMKAADGTPMPVLAVRRILIILESDSSASVLVCDHSRNSDSASVSSQVTEISLAANSRLNLYELEETSSGTGRLAHTFANLSHDSRLTMFSGMLKPGRTRNDITIRLNEPGASLTLDGMAIIDENRTGDNNVTVFHNVGHCQSEQTFKYLVDDRARGAFGGLIRVDYDAAGTEAHQTNRNLVASEGARMHTRPQLEIYCDDVKCSHGAATGQLDEQALFYMRSRGIDLPEAKTMLMNAFMSDVLDSVTLEPLRDRLRHLVERRLAGDDARCRECSINN